MLYLVKCFHQIIPWECAGCKRETNQRLCKHRDTDDRWYVHQTQIIAFLWHENTKGSSSLKYFFCRKDNKEVAVSFTITFVKSLLRLFDLMFSSVVAFWWSASSILVLNSWSFVSDNCFLVSVSSRCKISVRDKNFVTGIDNKHGLLLLSIGVLLQVA